MKLFFTMLLFIHSLSSSAQTKTQLERINFFPKSDAFLRSSYTHQVHRINTPQTSLMTKEVNNHSNIFDLRYGHRFADRFFAGVSASFEEASENAVRYGIPLRRRFNSYGFKEPEVFALYRLVEQKGEKGLIDLFLSHSPKGGTRIVGFKNSSRINGRPVTKLGISHGLWEEEWEFKSEFQYQYFGEGLEKNGFTQNDYFLEVYQDLLFNFQAQYRLNPWLFVHATVGFVYHGTQDISDNRNDQREIQSGTGSFFKLGLTKPLSLWTMVAINYSQQRNDYFIKGTSLNLEGREKVQDFTLEMITAF